MANPSHDKGNITDAEIAGFMGWRGPGAYTEASLRKIREIIDHVLRVERATPPSPSTAPEREYDPMTPLEAAALVGELERHRALASRPAEVDDDPPQWWHELQAAAEALDDAGAPLNAESVRKIAEQYRQGQRDAVAADRARREASGGGR